MTAEFDDNKRKLLPDMEKLGGDFKVRRERLKLSQAQVALWLGIAARKYGYFESGRARLTPKQLATVATSLERLEKGELYLRYHPLNFLSESEFLAVQQKMLNEWKYTDFWFFGLQQLPVLREVTYQQAWAENLYANTNYHLIWCLDEPMEAATFQLLQISITEVLERLGILQTKESKAAAGQIKLYPVTIGNPEAKGEENVGENYRRFNKLKAHLETNYRKHAVVYAPLGMHAPQFAKCRPILHYGWMRSVVCYEGERGANSFAALLHEHVSNDPKCSGDGESGWTFMTRAATANLLFHVHSFAECLPSNVQ